MDGPWTLVSSWTPWCSLPWLGILSRLLQHSRIQWYRIQWRASTPRIQHTCRDIFVFGILAKPFLIGMAPWPLPRLGPVVLRIVVDLRPSIFELHLEPGEFSLPDGNVFYCLLKLSLIRKMTYLHVFWRSLFRIIIDWIHCSPGKSPGKSDTTSLLYWLHACKCMVW